MAGAYFFPLRPRARARAPAGLHPTSGGRSRRPGASSCPRWATSRCGQVARGSTHSLALRTGYAIGPANLRARRPESTTAARHSMTDPSRAHADVANLFTASLAAVDPEVADVIERELSRQHDEIELIASENIVSKAVLEAQGSV